MAKQDNQYSKNVFDQLDEMNEKYSKVRFAMYKDVKKLKENYNNRKLAYLHALNEELDALDDNDKLILLNQKAREAEESLTEAKLKENEGGINLYSDIINEILKPKINSVKDYPVQESMVKVIEDADEKDQESSKNKQQKKTADNALPKVIEPIIKWNSKLRETKISLVAKCLTGENRFPREDLNTLNMIFLGEQIDQKLTWFGPANSLCTVFYELEKYNNILSKKESIAAFINKHFQYKNKGSIVDFQFDYVCQVLNDFKTNKRTRKNSKHYINIIEKLRDDITSIERTSKDL